MKVYHLLIISFFTSIIIFSCNSDEIICNPIETQSCNTGLLIMTSDGAPGATTIFTLDSIQKPVSIPLAFQNIQQNQQDDTQFDVFTRPSNYDAYNPATNQYFIEFPLQQRLYKYDIATQSRQELIVAGFYSAPVFNNGVLYTITIDNFGYATDPANYSIESINQNDGSLTNLISSSFPLISRFDWESMSSATDRNGNVYFVSGTNLISFNTTSTVANHIELVPTFDSFDNFQQFYGLELRNNGNLLAIRSRNDNLVTSLELVEIDINNPTSTPNIIFDFMAMGMTLNPEFYSTTYDACDDTYYVTSRSGANSTDFYEINLSATTVKSDDFPFYLMGVQTKNI